MPSCRAPKSCKRPTVWYYSSPQHANHKVSVVKSNWSTTTYRDDSFVLWAEMPSLPIKYPAQRPAQFYYSRYYSILRRCSQQNGVLIVGLRNWVKGGKLQHGVWVENIVEARLLCITKSLKIPTVLLASPSNGLPTSITKRKVVQGKSQTLPFIIWHGGSGRRPKMCSTTPRVPSRIFCSPRHPGGVCDATASWRERRSG